MLGLHALKLAKKMAFAIISPTSHGFESVPLIFILSSGNFEGAFQQALTANNLSLVLDTCEMVNPSQIFTSTPSLSQPILLSLIQQLSK